VACCRSPETAEKLKDFTASLDKSAKDRLDFVPLDLESQDSVEHAVNLIQTNYPRVDILLNVAGLLGDGQDDPGPERTVRNIQRDWMTKNFQVNVIGPVMFSQGLLPLMAQRRNHKSRPTSIVANLSARVGSISDNGLGGWYSYRMSKAALNQATRTLSHEVKRQGIRTIALHPGTTETDLSRPFSKNVAQERLFPVEFTVQSLWNVMELMEDEHSGGLYDWAGKAIPF